MIIVALVAFMLGAMFGAVLMAVMAAAGRDSWEEEIFDSLPGSAHPPGVSEARKEPGSTPLKIVP